MKKISRRNVLKAAGAVALYSALPAGVAAFAATRPTRFADPSTIIPNIYEWWTANDTSTLFQNYAGSTAVTSDGHSVRHWVGKVSGKVLRNRGDLYAAAPYKVNRIGSMPAVAFGGAASGLLCNAAHTCSDGATIIVIGKLTGTQVWRTIMSVNADTTNEPGNATYGAALGIRENGDRLGFVRNNILAQYDIPSSTPLVLVATVNQAVPSPADAGAGSVLSGYRSLYVNGGFPAAYQLANEQGMVDSTYISLGGRTDDWNSPQFDVCDAILVDGPCTPETLQELYDEYIYPTYGSYFTMEPYPAKKGLCNPFSGPGLNCNFCVPPLQDLVAMGITWVRVDVTASSDVDGIEDILTAYQSAGIGISWLLNVWDGDSDPGSFASPSGVAQTICDLHESYGFGVPFFELGNEIIQSYVAAFSMNENACADAYVAMLDDFRSEMTSYDYIVSGANDINVFTRKIYDRAVLAGVMPDLWGLHYYDVAATDAYGTSNLFKEVCQSSIVCTESNYSTPVVSAAEAVQWFSDMSAEMGEEPWIYYAAATADPWDVDDNGYPWYADDGYWDGNSVLRFPGTSAARSGTLEDTATEMTVELPTYVGANSISAIIGGSHSGSTSSIALPDDSSYQIAAANSSGHSVTETDIEYTVPSSVTSIAFNACLRATIADLHAYISVWNWHSSSWNSLGDFDVNIAGKAEKLLNVGLNPRLMDGSRTMKIKVHVNDKDTNVYPSFTSKLDVAQLIVTFT